jgi:hypothetical protein
MRFGFGQENRHLLRNARIEGSAEGPAAARLNLGNQRGQLFAVSASRKHRETFGGELTRDRGANVVAGANDCHCCVPVCRHEFEPSQ